MFRNANILATNTFIAAAAATKEPSVTPGAIVLASIKRHGRQLFDLWLTFEGLLVHSMNVDWRIAHTHSKTSHSNNVRRLEFHVNAVVQN